jgi:hypothetical protein
MTLQILSFWELMKRCDIWGLSRLLTFISNAQLGVKPWIDSEDRDEIVPPDGLALYVAGIIHHAQHIASALDLQSTYDRVWHGGGAFYLISTHLTWQQLSNELTVLRQAIEADLEKRSFVCIPQSLVSHFEAEYPFGKAVFDAFPSAREDLKEAGNCLACECNTASAFHLSRAIEVGLWELGRDRQIPLAISNKIEFTEWGHIIRELDIAVAAIQQWPNSSSKEDAHRFYNHAVVEIRAFNDGWRRHTAHARPSMPRMSNEEAQAFWGHGQRFMNTLAGKISEGHHTTLIW